MKKVKFLYPLFMASAIFMLGSCGNAESTGSEGAASSAENAGAGQSAVADDVSQKDIVKVAIGSKDHTTLVAAVQAADLVNVLANAGPFTVFAPTNAAFDALPAGTVDNLLKPENKGKLSDILQYHVGIGVFTEDLLPDGKELFTALGPNLKITKKDGQMMVNDAKVLGLVPASNGLIYIIDKVLLPPAAK